MSLRESYVSDLKNVPAKGRVFVMRHRGHDNLAPTAGLLADFKRREAELKLAGLGGVAAHNQAWEDVRYEERFAADFLANAAAADELKTIARLAAREDVYLICYEKPPKKCHRFLLLDYARRLARP